MKRPPQPMQFLVDGPATRIGDDTLRFPRTTREAFGHYAADRAPARITFLTCRPACWRGLAFIAALLLAALIIAGVR